MAEPEHLDQLLAEYEKARQKWEKATKKIAELQQRQKADEALLRETNRIFDELLEDKRLVDLLERPHMGIDTNGPYRAITFPDGTAFQALTLREAFKILTEGGKHHA